ncbi:unnamed protein product [Arctia plantaginis]|uniref:DUF4771 domain-containing protein n=1 Tax=Arctia plantaginis TaxID=874455 RepID=A0A8S1BQP1_ARCPL|nr:unnamed protein product [Arctia plantaginis]
MGKKKFKMPTVQQFLDKKRLYSKKKDLEWVYLEEEMLKNQDKKPYNKKVHDWLQYLKELRHYYHAESVRKEKRLLREAGPSWYCEFSTAQRAVLAQLKAYIHQDLLEDIPRRTRKALHDLGLTQLANKIPKNVLLKTLGDSKEDPGVFIWNLYTAVFNQSPSELRFKYDTTGRILMSCLVFIDLEDCVEKLENLTRYKKAPPIVKEPKKQQYYEPKVRYGQYLQRMYVPLYTTVKKKKKPEPLPLGNKLRLRSEESYEDLRKDTGFLVKRLLRNQHEQQQERVCNYKFWEPPSTLRNTDPKMVAYVNKLKMLKRKAKAKFKAPFKNAQFQIGGVSFTGGRPNYCVNNVALLPSGYILINAGLAVVRGDYVTCIAGFWIYPRKEVEKCDAKCDCLTKWEQPVMEFLKGTKCKCGHLYDLYNEGKPSEKFFYPPDKHGPFWIDKAKVFQMDPMEDFIKDTFREGLKSAPSTVASPEPSISASGLKESELLAAFLADLSDTYLVIPHLPEANLLNNLQEWVRNRVKGPLTPKQHRRLYLNSLRRWLDLKHVDHRARAYSIPFTLKQLEHFSWQHRRMVQELFQVLLDNFVTRNRLKQVVQTRMWWPTTKYDQYPGKPFLDIFFTYLPPRMQDVYFVNPYSPQLTPKYGAKTCPLSV